MKERIHAVKLQDSFVEWSPSPSTRSRSRNRALKFEFLHAANRMLKLSQASRKRSDNTDTESKAAKLRTQAEKDKFTADQRTRAKVNCESAAARKIAKNELVVADKTVKAKRDADPANE